MTKKLWGKGRFKKELDPLADDFLKSISFDRILAKYDIAGSIAHAKMLGKCGIIKKSEANTLVRGLKAIKKFEIEKSMAEDIHTAITNLLRKKVGKVADKLHTARSRNDQVTLDTKMYCKAELNQMINHIVQLQKSFLKFAKKNIKVIIPAYTHMQPAQCVLLAHHILAYLEMLERDKARLEDAYERTDELPLGSCALSGTSLKIDRRYVAKLLGFSRVSNNSIDAVSDRDFIAEILSAIAILNMHLSRISEDFMLWSTKEYNFVDIDESFCTGSSIMPHKKNPDVLEYIRGYAGKSYGNLISLLVTMKALPLTYNRDMQHDKEPLFNSVKTTTQILELLSKLIENTKICHENVKEALKRDIGIYSVDIVEDFVKNEGLSYAKAHEKTGKLMRCIYTKGKSEKADIEKNFTPEKSVNRKKSIGGTATELVKAQIKRWEEKLRA